MPLEIHIQGFDITNLDSRMQAMARPCYSALTNHAQDKPAIIFVPSKKHARQTAVDIWAFASADGKGDKFLQVSLMVYLLCMAVVHVSISHVGRLHVGVRERHDGDRKLMRPSNTVSW